MLVTLGAAPQQQQPQQHVQQQQPATGGAVTAVAVAVNGHAQAPPPTAVAPTAAVLAPLSGATLDNGAPPTTSAEAKSQYRLLKRRFKYLVYENECYQEEIRNLQRKLLKLSRDKKCVQCLFVHSR